MSACRYLCEAYEKLDMDSFAATTILAQQLGFTCSVKCTHCPCAISYHSKLCSSWPGLVHNKPMYSIYDVLGTYVTCVHLERVMHFSAVFIH